MSSSATLSMNSSVEKSTSVTPDSSNSSAVISPVSNSDKNSKEKPFVCDICHKTYTTAATRNTHREIHTKEKSFKCATCGKMFLRLAHLQAHRLTHTGERPFQCHLCGKTYVSHTSLKYHIHSHNGLKPYLCNICNKGFARTDSLTKHKLTHKGIKHYVCDICNKAFSQLIGLNNHIASHMNERGHECNICHKRYNLKHHLYAHLKVHTGEKPHGCSYCSKRFKTRQELQYHTVVHTNEKNYECPTCGQRFKTGSRLSAHKNKSSSGKGFKCDFCCHRFMKIYNLNKHMMCHKNEREALETSGKPDIVTSDLRRPAVVPLSPDLKKNDADRASLKNVSVNSKNRTKTPLSRRNCQNQNQTSDHAENNTSESNRSLHKHALSPETRTDATASSNHVSNTITSDTDAGGPNNMGDMEQRESDGMSDRDILNNRNTQAYATTLDTCAMKHVEFLTQRNDAILDEDIEDMDGNVEDINTDETSNINMDCEIGIQERNENDANCASGAVPHGESSELEDIVVPGESELPADESDILRNVKQVSKCSDDISEDTNAKMGMKYPTSALSFKVVLSKNNTYRVVGTGVEFELNEKGKALNIKIHSSNSF